MGYQMFFVPIKGYKLNYRLITRTRISLELDLEQLNIIFSEKYNPVDNQFIIDVLYLFGNITQIKKLFPLLETKNAPSTQIIMELICYGQLGKLVHILQNNKLGSKIINNITPLFMMISDPLLNNFLKMIPHSKPALKFILLSKNKPVINQTIDTFELSDIETAKYLLELEDIKIADKFDFTKTNIEKLIDWTLEADLLEMNWYLIQRYNLHKK